MDTEKIKGNRNMENKKFVLLNEEELDGVSGGIREFDDSAPTIYGPCRCGGRIYARCNGVDIPEDQMKCVFCGYCLADPSTCSNPDTVDKG